MSTSLYGLKPKDTYQALIKVGNNTSIDSTKKVLSDGLGNDLPIEVSTTEVNITGNLKQGGVAVPTASQVAAKQDTLVSGTNIKTINGQTVLGSGDLVISGASAVWGAITGTLSNQSDLQSALNAKVTANAGITSATKTKVTYDTKGLVTGGDDATTADIADSLNKRYVTDSQLTVIGNTSGTNTGDNSPNSLYSGLATSKQDTLISGTNIKTINSTSILGSGDVVVQAVLVSGTNIKTINSTSVLGSGNIAVQEPLVSGTNIQSINGSSILAAGDLSLQPTLVSGTNIKTINSNSLLGSGDITVSASPSGVAGAIQFSNGSALSSDATNLFWDDTNNRLGIGTNAPAHRLVIQGVGNTGGTYHFVTKNSAGVDRFYISDDGLVTINSISGIGGTTYIDGYGPRCYRVRAVGGQGLSYINLESAMDIGSYDGSLAIRVNDAYVGVTDATAIGKTTAPNSSAMLEIVSTSKGFLPPKMTTAQKTAIASPQSGLVVYDTTLNKLCVYTTAWETITSV